MALLEETNASGAAQADYIYLDGRPVATMNPSTGNLYYLHDDMLGTPQLATDSSQSAAWQAAYQPFGTASVSGTITQNLRFPGQYFDVESGWNHNGFRDYIPDLGRYAEPDPMALQGTANFYVPSIGRLLFVGPTQFATDASFYQYVSNSPTSSSDPLGLQSGNANTWTYGEIRQWAWLPGKGNPAPPGLGDAKGSIGAACALNGGGCNSVDGSNATDPLDQAAWKNIEDANGNDRSGGGNFMCVGSQGCWFVHRCYKCVNARKALVDRAQPLQPSGTVDVGKHMIYFYNDPLKGWCNEADSKTGCHCKK